MTLFGYISETVQQGLRVTINNHNIVKDWFKRWLPFNNNDKIWQTTYQRKSVGLIMLWRATARTVG